MNVLRLHGPRDLRLHEEPTPVPGVGELLLRVTAVGLCGSDRHWVLEGSMGDASLTQPLVLGHEFVAIVESGPRAGERVVLDPAVPCGACALCGSEQSHLCEDVRFAGHESTDGALRTLMAWPEHLAYRVPGSLSDVDAALLEPLGVVLHALDLGQVGSGTTAAVFGCGPIGLLTVQALRTLDATVVVATDCLPHRVAAAAELGAAHALEAGGRSQLEQPSGGWGVDVAFDASGDDAALADAIDAVRPGGLVVIVGIPDGDRTSFSASAARRKGLALLFCRRMQAAHLPRAIRLVESGGVELAPLVTERHSLLEWERAFGALVERRGIKTVVEPQRASGAEAG